MGLFNSRPTQHLKNINGYIIDELTGTLIDVPKGLKVYNIPKEVKHLKPELNMMTNPVLANLAAAEEIVFENGSIEKIPDNYFTFSASSNLKNIILPTSIKQLGDRCFDPVNVKCSFPNSIEYLGANMYPETQKLVIGNNVKKLGNSFASHDTNLVYIEVAGSIKELPSDFVNQCKNLKTLILHEGIEKAGNNAFRNLNSLEYVELPDSFKMPFKTSMENREGSNKRGNSKYNGTNGIFEAQENNILTIKKIHNGISYTFQVRRGDFAEISFQNKIAIIRSRNPQYGNINIDLEKLSLDAICQVNIQESKVQQAFIKQQQQPNQNQISNQQIPDQPQQSRTISPTGPDPLNFGYTDEVLRNQFQKLYKESIIPSNLFKSLNGSKQIVASKALLYEEFCKRVRLTNNLNINSVVLYAIFQGVAERIKNDPLMNLTEQQGMEEDMGKSR